MLGHGIGDGDHPLGALEHPGAPEIGEGLRRVKAVAGEGIEGARLLGQLSGNAGHGRRMGVDDGDPVLPDQLHQPPGIGPAPEGILAGQLHADMRCAAAQQIGHQPAAPGDDHRSAAGSDHADGRVDRRAGRAVGPEIGDHLQHAQAVGEGRPEIRAMDIG